MSIRFLVLKVAVLTTACTALLLGASLATVAIAGHHASKSHDLSEAQSQDIIEVAVAAGDFNTLAAALKAAGLVDTLKGDGPFTVFAPTDAAFAKLPDGTVEMLLKPENKDQLVAVLTYHVVSGEVKAEQVVSLKTAETVNGKNLTIAVSNGNVMVDSATVVATDIAASNGVIHVIDQVMLP